MITILPETKDATLCLSFSGIITAEEFTELHEKPLNDIIAKYDHYNLCIVYEDDFEKWSQVAADLSFKCIASVATKSRKAAYVNPPDSRMVLMKMMKPIVNAEVRYFDKNQRQEALDWVRS